jgi:two-component system sensor histidine kinase/response regulator
MSAQKDRVLVVDDSPDNLFLIEHILDEEGYEIILVRDGFTALELIKQSPPQLILLDVMMPQIDGFEVTRRIREDTTLPFIPILLITAYDQPSVVKGLDLGADDFIRKPVDIDELLARARSLLRLKHSVDAQEYMAKVREDFVSRLTHDLRTPLVAADRMLTLFQQGALGELSSSILEAIAIMIRSNRHLLEMVNMMLEVYRYEADRKILTLSQVDLDDLTQEVIQELAPLAQEKGLSLTYQRQDEYLFKTTGDRLEFHRLLTNLIGNAIKFTERGSVEVQLQIRTDPDHPNAAEAVIMVRDTGPGISLEEQQEGLFNRFRSGSHRQAGSGLGLHLSHQIVEAHHGKIEVQSQLGQGSVFIVRLPTATEVSN